MKIYNLHIITSEDKKEITDKTHLYKDSYGYFSTLENVKNAILNQMEIIENDFDEFPEFVHRIYCDVIEVDVTFSDDITLFFNESGDLIKSVLDYGEVPKNPLFKIGDLVTTFSESGKKVEVGVIVHSPSEHEDASYTIYYSEDNDYMDHTHLPEDWIYKVDSVSEELRIKLDKTLKSCIGNKEYQLLKREDKLKNIIK